ncbi:MAG: hypothetical protein MK212_14335 [Saprospiraceae bacterium]|nr:hypothetical protein [Saprospiraceae bacterium]
MIWKIESIIFILFVMMACNTGSSQSSQGQETISKTETIIIITDEFGHKSTAQKEQEKYIDKRLKIEGVLDYYGEYLIEHKKEVVLNPIDTKAQETLEKIAKQFTKDHPDLEINALGISHEKQLVACYHDTKKRPLLDFVEEAKQPVGSLIYPLYYVFAIEISGYNPCMKIHPKNILEKGYERFGLEEDYYIENPYNEYSVSKKVSFLESLKRGDRTVVGFILKNKNSVEPFETMWEDLNLPIKTADNRQKIDYYFGDIELPILAQLNLYNTLMYGSSVSAPVKLIQDVKVKEENSTKEECLSVYELDAGVPYISKNSSWIILNMLKNNVIDLDLGYTNIISMKGISKDASSGSFILASEDLLLGVYLNVKEGIVNKYSSIELSELASEITSTFFKTMKEKQHYKDEVIGAYKSDDLNFEYIKLPCIKLPLEKHHTEYIYEDDVYEYEY